MKKADEPQYDSGQQLFRPSAGAVATGRREPYYLTYARKHKEEPNEQSRTTGDSQANPV